MLHPLRQRERNARLRARVEAQDEGILLVPGVYDGLSARLAERAGAEAVYLSGSGVASSLGVPDIGLVTFNEMLERLAQITDVVRVPVIADADTGYGGPLNVVRTVRAFERAGASAIQLEDQVFPKRCGHFEGKRVVPLEEMLAKLYAALDAREDENVLIIARTDARATHGLDEALRRGRAFAEAGADLVFIEAPRSWEELARIPREIEAPLLVNLPEGGKTPLLPLREFERLGYRVVVHANTALRAAAKTMAHVYRRLLERGTSLAFIEELITFHDRDEITELFALQEREESFRRRAQQHIEHKRESDWDKGEGEGKGKREGRPTEE